MARLSAEYPGIRAETLRLLEEQGLIAPSRTSSGFRRYAERDLDAVRRALSGPPRPRAERPALTPAVSVHSTLWRGPATPGAQAASEPPEPPARPEPCEAAAGPQEASSGVSQGAARRRGPRWPEPDYFTPELGEVALGRRGLARAAGLDETWVAELAAHGLISGRDPASGADLLVARAAAELLGYGIEPRHLRPVNAAADRAAALISAASGGSGRSGTARAAAALVRLEAALLRAALLDD